MSVYVLFCVAYSKALTEADPQTGKAHVVGGMGDAMALRSTIAELKALPLFPEWLNPRHQYQFQIWEIAEQGYRMVSFWDHREAWFDVEPEFVRTGGELRMVWVKAMNDGWPAPKEANP